MFAFTRVLDILAREQKSLDELAAPYRARFQSGELNYKVVSASESLVALRGSFADAEKFSEIDGLSIFYKDWWFNVRPSNTEPLLRLTIEADTAELLEQKKKELSEFIGE